MKKYILTSTTYHIDNDITFYGIALIETNGKSYELIETYNDLTESKDKVQALINHCNSTNLNNIHFENIVQDLIAE